MLESATLKDQIVKLERDLDKAKKIAPIKAAGSNADRDIAKLQLENEFLKKQVEELESKPSFNLESPPLQ